MHCCLIFQSVRDFEKSKILHFGEIDFQKGFFLPEITGFLGWTDRNRFYLQTIRKAQLKIKILQR